MNKKDIENITDIYTNMYILKENEEVETTIDNSDDFENESAEDLENDTEDSEDDVESSTEESM